MLTAGAENALLKTLEEPPAHVTWVLATTEPHKVVQTIRSRCQVFELGLIPADIMSDHLRYVVADAELDADDDAIDHAVASGGGSVRDTLTALERGRRRRRDDRPRRFDRRHPRCSGRE